MVLLPLLVAAGSTRAEAQTKTYVAHSGANVVSVIDPASDTVKSVDPAAAGPVRVVIARKGDRAFVADGESNFISVIETTGDTVLEKIPVGAGPSSLAVSPDGRLLYVMTAAGVVQVVDIAEDAESHTVVAEIPIGASGDIAITPDGNHLYVAAGLVYAVNVIDLANPIVHSFAAEKASVNGVTNTATLVAMSPNDNLAYIGVVTFDFSGLFFSAGGGLVLVDTVSESVADVINLFSLPGAIAFTPDGSRAYVGVQNYWVDTLYGAGFFPGRHMLVIDTMTKSIEGLVDFGASGVSYTDQNTPSGIGVTPNRHSVYVAVPRLGQVLVADVNTNTVSGAFTLAASPGDLAIVADATAPLAPYVSDAVDDAAEVTTVGGTAIVNVLDNDHSGGIAATSTRVSLTALSSTSDRLALDAANGDVNVAAGIEAGSHTLAYRICDTATLSSCDDATVNVAVRAPYVIDAVNDSAVSFPGRSVLASVLANDTLNGAPATSTTVTLSAVSSTSSGILFDTWSGSVFVLVGTPPGTQTLTYRVCETASPTNCDDADVTITVNPFPIDAVDDAGAATRSGGIALGSVLANDTFAGEAATLARVTLAQLASTDAGISLNVANGAVTVAAGTAVGTHTLTYAICEIEAPSNCDKATVTVTVQPLQITAVGDSGRGSSKSANIVIANVLANDWLGSGRATTANVSLSLVSLSPANKSIKLDADGSVDVLGKTISGLYQLVYEICEIAAPANCARATAKIDLSGGGGGR